jgi:hypothetical protein
MQGSEESDGGGRLKLVTSLTLCCVSKEQTSKQDRYAPVMFSSSIGDIETL